MIEFIGTVSGGQDPIDLFFDFVAGQNGNVNLAPAHHGLGSSFKGIVAQIAYAGDKVAQTQSEENLSAAGQ